MEDKFKKIKAFAFDVDGVLTNGGVLADVDGELFRTFDAKDSFGMRMAAMNGYLLCTITGGRSESIRKRMITCGVKDEDIYMGSRKKILDFEDFCKRHSLKSEEVMYFGDDIPDVPVLEACGCGVCPADAVIEAKEAADLVSPYPGGARCVRNTIEEVMRLQGRWIVNLDLYQKMF